MENRDSERRGKWIALRDTPLAAAALPQALRRVITDRVASGSIAGVGLSQGTAHLGICPGWTCVVGDSTRWAGVSLEAGMLR